jgi:hypothetical protein
VGSAIAAHQAGELLSAPLKQPRRGQLPVQHRQPSGVVTVELGGVSPAEQAPPDLGSRLGVGQGQGVLHRAAPVAFAERRNLVGVVLSHLDSVSSGSRGVW